MVKAVGLWARLQPPCCTRYDSVGTTLRVGRGLVSGSSMKRLDYENPREKKIGAYANELLRGELRGQTAVVGVRFSPRA